MKLKLSLLSGGQVHDVLVTIDATASVGALAERLRTSHPTAQPASQTGDTPTLRVQTPGMPERAVDPSLAIGDAGIRSGDLVALAVGGARSNESRVSAATLHVLRGPDAGKAFPIGTGTSFIGRDRGCEIRLSDPQISKRHLRVTISDVVEVIDENSANGTQVSGESIQRAALRPTDVVQVGETHLTIVLHDAPTAAVAQGGPSHTVEFNRSPRLDPKYEGVELIAPEPPQRIQPQRFPLIPLVAPILMAGIMYAVTKNALSILFVALSPIMLVGTFMESRLAAKKAFEQGSADFRAGLRDLAVQLQYASDLERSQRRREHPSSGEVFDAVQLLAPLTWTRRPRHESFLQVRLGLGTLPSRNTVKLTTTNNTTPELWRELHAVAGQFATVDRVPVVASLRNCGGLGVAGPTAAAHPLAASVIGQIVGEHSPAEVVLAAVTSSASMARWAWLKWLPHAGSDQSPLTCDHLTSTPAASTALTSELEDLVRARSELRREEGELPLPVIVLLVEDDAALERARLVTLADVGPHVGVFVIWVALALDRVPAACRAFLEVDERTGEGRAGFVDGGIGVGELELEPLPIDQAAAMCRRMSPLVDAGALLEDQSDLPRSVSFLTLGGLELADSVDDVVERWRGSNSLPPEPGAPRLKRDNNLRALVGQATADRFYLDLRTNGPHALVGGTTGAGKSEFLQSWIIGLAAAHSPARVNFLFVDYKGGAAFADCLNLPHCVGLVTDLSPHLVRRALRSLNAELRRREHILNRKKAKDLLELERRRDPDTPPSLVIVVDEFAALVSEVPEFVDGVVNVAQRGRSLGLHLILATQRPAGVIKDNLRANTNLRVALRMADEADSEDVIGTHQAAGFDPSIPGRGVAKTGPGRLTSFQSAYVGGHTSNTPAMPVIDVNEFRFGIGAPWDVPEGAEPIDNSPLGHNDIHRVVVNVQAAATRLALAETRKPWLPELAPSYRLEELPSRRTDQELVFGVIDRPDEQDQPVVAFRPDVDGNMAVYGTGGSGKSTFLRTLAVAAGFAPARGGPCTVYALDFGSRGMQMIEGLPHVGAVINAEETERIVRLLRQLRATIDDRAERYAKANASTIEEYRQRASQPDEARILLLVDNFGAFRQAYEMGPQSRWFETFQSIASDGRSVGVHIVLSADRPGAVPSSLNSAIQRRLVFRLTGEMDYTMLNTADDVLTAASPPGRGLMDDCEVQVGVLGGDPNVAKQASEIARLAAAMERAGMKPVPRIESLSDRILPSEMPDAIDGRPVLGVWDETLAPIAFDPSGVFVVTGPPQSGKSNTVLWMVDGLRRANPSCTFALFGTRRSMLLGACEWAHRALTPDDMEELATDLADRVAADDPSTASLVVVVESIGELLNGPADMPLQDLFKACRAMDRFVIAEGETSAIGSSWPLLQAIKASRYGIAMQPEQVDGDGLFKTSFPRITRSEFPQGRGVFVRSGRVARVQVPLMP
jgi:S-DNA-T family DNA segregation ATPase FtsK/SpoIIIE